MRKIACHKRPQHLFLQMITLEVDSAYAQYIRGMETADYAIFSHKKGIFTAC